MIECKNLWVRVACKWLCLLKTTWKATVQKRLKEGKTKLQKTEEDKEINNKKNVVWFI